MPHVKYATVGGKDPYADFPASLAVLVSSDRVLSGVNATTGRPVTAALTPFGQTGCMLLVDPAGYANITSRYPIMAVSYLIANNKGNTSTDVGAVRGLIGSAYADHTTDGVTTIGANTGYAFLSSTALTQAKVDSCVNI